MFKFATNKLNRKQTEENDARRKLQKDLFAFSKIADKGFPSKPSAMDYDKKLNLLAIGTKSGDIRIYGAPGIELSSYQEVPFPIQKLLFVQGTGQLLSLVERINRNDVNGVASSSLKCEITYHLILWQITSKDDVTNVEKKKEYQIEPKLGRVSAVALLHDNSHLFIGFESGDIYVFKLSHFSIVPGAIHKEFIIKSLPESLKKNPGAVESLCQHPRKATKLLIAYNRGLIIIFDFSNESSIDYLKTTNQQIESACFYQSGRCIATSHTDGSFILWDIENDTNSQANIVYGPFPCRPVNKILVKTVKNNEPFVIFSGGVPRATYSDKISISVIQGENNHVAFDFTSKIIDFITVDDETNESTDKHYSYDNPKALFVLLEEEFVAIDLLSDNWPQFKLPYLNSVHSSAIICTHYCNNITTKLFNRLLHIGNQQLNGYTDKEWPLSGNTDIQTKNCEFKDLLLTGHEDGSIRFWDVTNNSLQLLYKLKTADFFQTDCAIQEDNDDENWPPFRKVGHFDPYSDDPKLGIQKIILCPLKEILLIAGTAGQLIVMNMSEKFINECSLKVCKINIVTDMDGFIWKGHDPLLPKDQVKLLPGFQPISVMQLYPPATISALCLNSDWKLVCMGTSHGFAIFDYCQQKELLVRCTLDPNLLISNVENLTTTAASGAISRRKSLKKSLRESFRKLRRGRSQKTGKKDIENKTGITSQLNNDLRVDEIDHHKPIERQVESREFKQMDDIPPSVIRYMYFVRTYVTNSSQLTNSLWVGTNTGIIYIYALQIPEKNKRFDIQVNCILAKEMRLKHRAPVVHIQVIDQTCSPIPESSAFEQPILAPSGSSSSHQNETSVIPNHKVIICSEEQFKVFQLPTLKPFCKFKLTAIEGARVRRIGYTKYISKSDSSVFEYCLSCLSNLGDLSVYSLPNLKRQVQIQCMKQQDINAITSFVFSKYGQAYYLQSPSEFLHISMSAADTTPHHLNINNVLNQHQNNKADNEKFQKIQDDDSNQNKQILKSLPPPPPIPSTVKDKTFASPTSPPPPIPAPRTSTNTKFDIKQSISSAITNNKTIDNAKSFALKQTELLLNENSSSTAANTATATATTATATTDTVNTTNTCNSKTSYKENREQPCNQETESEQLINNVETDPTTVDENQITLSSPSQKKANIIQKQNHLNESSSFNATDLSLSTSSTYLINGHLSNGAVSTSGISSFQSSDLSGVDLSMDSIVDKFSEEFNDLSTKIKPINEDAQHDNNCANDIKINLTNTCNINKKSAKTQKLEKKIDDVELIIDNYHSDESSNHVDSVAKNIKSYSIKHYGDNNNLASSINDCNKIENATKIIKNGNKLEYRETAID